MFIGNNMVSGSMPAQYGIGYQQLPQVQQQQQYGQQVPQSMPSQYGQPTSHLQHSQSVRTIPNNNIQPNHSYNNTYYLPMCNTIQRICICTTTTTIKYHLQQISMLSFLHYYKINFNKLQLSINAQYRQ